jgi:hypothetical protein
MAANGVVRFEQRGARDLAIVAFEEDTAGAGTDTGASRTVAYKVSRRILLAPVSTGPLRGIGSFS